MLSILLALCFAASSNSQTTALNTITDAAQLSAVISSKYVRASQCSDLLRTCQPTASSCAESVCQTCTGLGQSKINACCSSGTAPTQCFIDGLTRTGDGVYPSTATPPPVPSFTGVSIEAGELACESSSKYESYCNSVSPGFAQYTAFALQAPCLCYNGTSWSPQIFDGYVSSCISWLGASTAVTTPLTTAPCSSVGDVTKIYSYTISVTGAPPQAGQTSSPTTTTTSEGAERAQAGPVAVVAPLAIMLLLLI